MNTNSIRNILSNRKLFVFLLLALNLSVLYAQTTKKSIYDYDVETIDGEILPMSTFKGKKLMIVNVASACGLTPQYEQLQALYEKYKDRDFTIIAFPSNDFKQQESGSNEKIKSFCSLNYGVTFPMMAKIKVLGNNKAPIYQWLTQKDLNQKGDYDVSWNFQKFLINSDGTLSKVMAPKTKPDDLEIISWISSNETLAQNKVKAPEFSYNQMDTNKKIALSDFKGKYILIDFWASWCPPCRAAVPFLKDAYAKYKTQGFEILGVSLDKNEAAWKKSVIDKEMNWPQTRTSDEGTSITKLYSFNTIPYFVLVDPQGYIVAKGFKATDINQILSQHIK